jgi:hypothetical protein
MSIARLHKPIHLKTAIDWTQSRINALESYQAALPYGEQFDGNQIELEELKVAQKVMDRIWVSMSLPCNSLVTERESESMKRICRA